MDGIGVIDDDVCGATSVTGASSGIVIMSAFDVGARWMRRSLDRLRKIEGVSRAVRFGCSVATMTNGTS
jgi:hypothetical protein